VQALTASVQQLPQVQESKGPAVVVDKGYIPHGWMNEWMNEWMDGWMNECMNE